MYTNLSWVSKKGLTIKRYQSFIKILKMEAINNWKTTTPMLSFFVLLCDSLLFLPNK